MWLKSIFLSVIILLISFNLVYSQKNEVKADLPKPTPTPKKETISPELKKDVIELVRESVTLTRNFNSVENRIHYTVKSSEVLWEYDEKEAREGFQNAITDFQTFSADTDTEFLKIESLELVTQQATAQNPNTASVSNQYSQSKISNLYSRPNKLSRLRAGIISSIGTRDPSWAYEFFIQTKQLFNSKVLQDAVTGNDSYTESNLLMQIANKDVTLALELGRKKLEKGVSNDLLPLSLTIYNKDSAKGAVFADEIVKKLISQQSNNNLSVLATNLLRFGSQMLNEITTAKKDKKPYLSESSIRSLAEFIAKSDATISNDLLAVIEKYSPSSATAIKQKAASRTGNGQAVSNGRGTGSGRGSGIVGGFSENNPNRFMNYIGRLGQETMKGQANLNGSIARITKDKKTEEELEKVFEEKYSEINIIENPEMRFSALIALANQSVKLEKKDLAERFLEEARVLNNSQLKKQQDFSFSFQLASSYAQLDTDKSFMILENTIYQLNEVISAFIKVSEYNGSFGGMSIEEGELQMASNQFSNRFFSISPDTSQKLAAKDFERLKNLTDKFERLEMRVESKILIIKNLLTPPPNQRGNNTNEKNMISPPPPVVRVP
ncbi:MAG: hypothetical protein MUC29_11455 [Pyrinomonadaceae bacterium]|nr:hypothetical protein [Pyrinomonadaceae bacterium]